MYRVKLDHAAKRGWSKGDNNHKTKKVIDMSKLNTVSINRHGGIIYAQATRSKQELVDRCLNDDPIWKGLTTKQVYKQYKVSNKELYNGLVFYFKAEN